MDLNGSADDVLVQLFMKKLTPCLRNSGVNTHISLGRVCSVLCDSGVNTQVCNTPTLNSGTSGFRAAASRACTIASRVSMGSMILSIHKRAAP